MKNHPLYSLFKYFPQATVCVAGWDREVRIKPIEKYWHQFTLPELKAYNIDERYSVYFTPSNMSLPTHKLIDHKDICAWYCDIDVSERGEDITIEEREDRKAEALGRIFIHKNLLVPSFVVETRNGFHVYWLSKGTPSKARFTEIEEYIVKALKGDEKACKLVQLMRLPGFYNWKFGGKNPCRIIPQLSTMEIYEESDWDKYALQKKPESKEDRKATVVAYESKVPSGQFCIFEYAAEYPQLEAMRIFSGTDVVNGENYAFYPTMGGSKMNIVIDGVTCSAFIDIEKNKIFCRQGTGKGSPNIIEWIKWYNDYPDPSLLALTLTKHLCPSRLKTQ